MEAERYVILFCEGRTVPAKIEFATVRDVLLQDIHEKKLRLAMAGFFEHLQDNATIDNFLAGTTRSPKKLDAKPAPQAMLPGKPTASR